MREALIKQRNICFCRLAPSSQGESACQLLQGIEGISKVELLGEYEILVSYDLHYLSIKTIEEALNELGYKIESSLLQRLVRALHTYSEECERTNLGVDPGQQVSLKLFINRYQQLDHSCRDQRPDYWRDYH
ncbi:MAG: heavy-metal-associated domain-containing protein [Gammaproteobacteria bacterium]|nr:heavy-metal-associated domain-containing protein [Gammaproteobacteria bacterium]